MLRVPLPLLFDNTLEQTSERNIYAPQGPIYRVCLYGQVAGFRDAPVKARRFVA